MWCGRIRVFPSMLTTGADPAASSNTVNHVYFLFSALRTAYQAYGRHSDQQDQRAVENYMSGSQSATELEYRELQWLRARS